MSPERATTITSSPAAPAPAASAAGERVFRRNWRARPACAVSGEGIYIRDESGEQRIDAVSGVYVSNIGHGVERVAEAIASQARRIAFPYAGNFTSEPERQLAERVIELAPPGMSKVYFVSGGSEANEVAVKLARKYQQVRGRQSRWRIVGRDNSYHGATMTSLALSGHPSRRRDFLPYLSDFPHIPAPYCYRCPLGLSLPECGLACAARLDEVLAGDAKDTIAGFIAEPIVGAALGAVVPPPDYYRTIETACRARDILFIADEVITGFGRTGTCFAIERYGVTPDIIVCGKGLAGGYAPLGAVIIHERVIEALEASSESSLFTGYTFSGNPISCAAGLAVLDCVEEWGLIERAARSGELLEDELESLARRHWSIGEVRGRGMFWGVELVRDRASKATFPAQAEVGARLRQACWQRGAIVHCESWASEQGEVQYLILAPPLIASERELRKIVSIIDEAWTAVEATLGSELGCEGASG